MSQTLFNANQLGPNTAIVRQDFTSSASQTSFTMTGVSFSGGILFVHVGGSLLKLTDDYTISGTNIVSLNTPLSAGVLVNLELITPATASFLSASAVPVPTRQVLTSGTSATYNTPSGARQLKIRMVGGGGGGGAAATNGGTAGNTTIFNSINANGGGAGAAFNAGSGRGGAGGSGGTGTASFRIPGNGGGMPGGAVANGSGAGGGGGCFGGGGQGITTVADGQNGGTNSGGGGSGGFSSGGGAGGGGGECAEIIINSPAATYTYTVGTGGNGGAAGVQSGGNGGSGLIIVDEVY